MRFKLAVLSLCITLPLATPLFAQEKSTEALIRGQNQLLSQVMSLLLEQNQILKHLTGTTMTNQNESRMSNLLLCDLRNRIKRIEGKDDSLVSKLCQSIRAEYDAVQKAIEDVRKHMKKDEKS